MDGQAPVIEALHKACGRVEVAKDLLGRSGSLYLQIAQDGDHEVSECFTSAETALQRVVDVLQVKMAETTLGPAA